MDVRKLSRSVPDCETWFPETEEDREAVREQLGRLLASPVLGRSKGCSNLLAYIVNRTLEGGAEHLKERTIGTEALGRAPDYDTAFDHVVRSTAGEVRKRLAQYYMEPGRSREIRIDVPSGSYVPRFTRYTAFSVATPQGPEETEIAPVSVPEPSAVVRPGAGRLRFRLVAISIAVVAVAALSMLAFRAYSPRPSGSTLGQFWQPVLQSPNPVLLCIGDSEPPAPAAQPGSPQPAASDPGQVLPSGAFRGSERVFLNDAITLARISGWLQQNAKPYTIFVHSRVAFSDLQNSPAVLIGLRNNYWTASLAGPHRFTVERGTAPNTLTLRDKKNPSRNDWSVDLSTPYAKPTKDYALIARELHPKTGQVVVTVGGITRHGTLAASEFLTNPEQIKKLDAYGPKGWENKNVAIVLSTEVIRGSPGSARIVAVDFW